MSKKTYIGEYRPIDEYGTGKVYTEKGWVKVVGRESGIPKKTTTISNRIKPIKYGTKR